MKQTLRNLSVVASITAACLSVPMRAIAQATTDAVYPTTEIPCPYPAILEGEVFGETYTCGLLTVPENYDQPEGRQIELSYTVLDGTVVDDNTIRIEIFDG